MLSTNRLLVNKQDTLRGFTEVVLTLAVNHFSLYNGFLVPTPRPLSYRSFYNLLRFSSLGIVSIKQYARTGSGTQYREKSSVSPQCQQTTYFHRAAIGRYGKRLHGTINQPGASGKIREAFILFRLSCQVSQ